VSIGAWLVIAATVPGCYRTPAPACGFVCGLAGSCPDNYTCSADDNRCHLNGASSSCETALDAGFTDDGSSDGPPAIYVVESTPANGDLDVALTPTTITLTYNVVISGVDIGSVALFPELGAVVPVDDQLTGVDNIVTITPAYQLTGSTTYQLDVGMNFTAPTGSPQTEYDIQFTTAADTVPPTVTTVPMNNDTNVDTASVIVATFSEPVLGVDTTTFVVSSGGPLTGTVAPMSANDPTVWVFTPDAPLPSASTIELQLLAGITDTSNNPLAPIDYTFVTM